MWRAAPAGMRRPASAPTACSDGPPVSRTRSVSIDAGGRLDAGDARPSVVEAQTGERGPLAQLHAGPLHRQRVGAHVARRVDVAVARPIAAAAMAGRGRESGHRSRRPRPAISQRTSVRPAVVLHRDALATESLVLLGRREDEVAELAEARVGAVGGRLTAVEVDRPATERHRRRRAALGPDDAGRARRRAHPDEAAFEHDDPTDPVRRGEDRRPAADRARPDDDQVRSLRHRSTIGPRGGCGRPRRTSCARIGALSRRARPPRRRPRSRRAGRVGRRSSGAGPSRRRARGRRPGRAPPLSASMTRQSAAMAVQRSSTAAAIVVGSRSCGSASAARPGPRPATRSSAARLERRDDGVVAGRTRGRRPGPRRRPDRGRP